MPPKKPVRRTNKKKGGGGGDNGGGSCNKNPPPRVPLGEIPGGSANSLPRQEGGEDKLAGGLYGVYKRATQRFKDGLAALVPAEIFAEDRVQTIMDAVDYIMEQNIAISSLLLEDCRISLSFRKKYSKRMDDGGDEGHEYFILVLNYCYQSLKPLVPKITQAAAKENARQFHFTDLDLSDSEEEEEKEGGDGDSTLPITTVTPKPEQATTIRKPKRPNQPSHDFTFDDLIKGSDRLQACAFLDSVDIAMETVVKAYRTLKLNMRHYKIEDPYKASLLMEDVMEAAVTTNFCIRQVQLMEEELKVDHPHLSSFYRVLGCVSLVHCILEFNNYVRDWGKSVPKTEMTAFIGDVVECGFRDPQPSDPQHRLTRLIRDFCRKWTLPREKVTEIMDGVLLFVHTEVQINNVVQPPEVAAKLRELGLTPHRWLQHKQFIGGDRNILNTQRLVQGLSTLLTNYHHPKLEVKAGSFGRRWEERYCLAKKIQGDMDQLLMGDILPELLASCRRGALSSEVPRMDELLPLFKLLRQYIDKPSKPVPLSLTFGVHSILASIFELQGRNDVTWLAIATKVTYNCFFAQLQQLMDSFIPNSKSWRPNLQQMMSAKLLPTCAGPPVNQEAEANAFWNPCCGGMFNVYLCYQINLERGVVMIDSFAQLRIVLHLYNAMQQRNLISDNIPLLTSLDKFFDGVQSVWQGEKPTRGNIVKRFWFAYGKNEDDANRLHEECRRLVLGGESGPPEEIVNIKDGGTTRELTVCRPEDLSKSYCRICLGDFSGMVDRYWENHISVESLPAWQYDFMVRLNDTLDMMTSEEELLSWNLMAVGGWVNGFLYELVGTLKWKQFSNAGVATLPADGRRNIRPGKFIPSEAYDQRFSLVTEIVNKLLGPLEFLDSVEDDPVFIATRDCFKLYFAEIDLMRYHYFPTSAAGKGPKGPTASPIFDRSILAQLP